ncbi:malto-oligosyltrehalose trehalohydrolase [Chryseosolibacter indicus]|uniref:Malto-oligosyltrehalose trehalohydrolase n=1 Tax=Chryseosolibacter indicus TaxID=2782351 RepID=A0ABS5VLJ7_9BACT|nr:malto-oligosyltrehalose trehalohydrolase [Chryseosolibacter indicus]MBT1702246.1 malto-oligosyltrehalose trehalohydrolase [Chryseosolibacter indicus]
MGTTLATNLAGARFNGSECTFSVWAPLKERMILHLTESKRQVEMKKDDEGYFSITLKDVKQGAKYFFRPDNEKDYPDPTSFYQPEGVHGPSQVYTHDYEWKDQAWRGLPFKDLILYEVHVGTFTQEGTFEAIIPYLDELYETGINALELMPVSQFSGGRNWGYDGVYPYAVQNTYGGPDGLKRLVDACHQRGIAVFLDVVYNHIGPEGNYLPQYGPYFTDTYCTPWGDAINFDGDWSDGVRDYFCNNALYWFKYFHLDGLRLDAIHMAYDNGAYHFWQYVNDKVKQLQEEVGRPLHMIAESDLNSPRVINPLVIGGYGFTAQWLDDFHHALYVMLDPKGRERYIDFGLIEQLAKAYTDGFVHSGEYVKFRKRKHGVSSAGIPGDKFVAFNLNHDQIGNRIHAERLCVLVNHEKVKLGAAALMLSPYVPMLFMGEEYADQSPFYYFVSHTDPALVEAVRKGRKEEFKDYKGEGESPDPYDEKTFNDSKLKWVKRNEGKHKITLEWHKRLIQLRRSNKAIGNFDKNDITAQVIAQDALVIHRQAVGGSDHVLCLFNFGEQKVRYTMPLGNKKWRKILDSQEVQWSEDGKQKQTLPSLTTSSEEVVIPPTSVIVYEEVR